MTVRLAVPEAFAAEGARVRRALEAAGVTPTVVAPDAQADLVLRAAEGTLDVPRPPAAVVIGLAEPRDALVTAEPPADSLDKLPSGARVGLSGRLRREMLGVHRPDLTAIDVADAASALDLLDRGEIVGWIAPLSAVRASGAGDDVRDVFEPTSWASAAGRGALLLHVRASASEVAHLVAVLDEAGARSALEAETAVLRALGVGVEAPVGVIARPHGPLLRIRAFVPAAEGRRLVRVEVSGRLDAPLEAARRVARQLVDRGALELMGSATASV